MCYLQLFLPIFFIYFLIANWLAYLYIHGESTFEILEQGKMKSVVVNRTEHSLTDEAISQFKEIHDEWELDVCEKNPYDPLLGGNYFLYYSPYLLIPILKGQQYF